MESRFLRSAYKDTDSQDDRVAIAVLLLIVSDDEKVKITIDVENSSTLSIVVFWLAVKCEANILLISFLSGHGVTKIHSIAPMLGIFNSALRELNPERDGERVSVARIGRPFLVKPDIESFLLPYRVPNSKLLLDKMEVPTSRFAKPRGKFALQLPVRNVNEPVSSISPLI